MKKRSVFMILLTMCYMTKNRWRLDSSGKGMERVCRGYRIKSKGIKVYLLGKEKRKQLLHYKIKKKDLGRITYQVFI